MPFKRFIFIYVYIYECLPCVPLEAWRMSWIPWVPCSKSDRWVYSKLPHKVLGTELGSSERVSAANWGDIPPACSLFLELDSPFGPIILRFVFFQCHVYLGIPIGTSISLSLSLFDPVSLPFHQVQEFFPLLKTFCWWYFAYNSSTYCIFLLQVFR